MDIRFSDKRCLTPSLLDASGRSAGRVEGVLESAAGPGGPTVARFVDAVDYDGRDCRYRVASSEAREGARWVVEDGSSAFRPFSRLVVDRLCAFERDLEPSLHRFPGGPSSRVLTRSLRQLGAPFTLTVLDTCVTPDGALWLRAALRGDSAAGWRSRHRADDPHVEGWLTLAVPAQVLGEADPRIPRACAAVA